MWVISAPAPHGNSKLGLANLISNLALQDNQFSRMPRISYGSPGHASPGGPGPGSARQVNECPLPGGVSRLGNVRSWAERGRYRVTVTSPVRACATAGTGQIASPAPPQV